MKSVRLHAKQDLRFETVDMAPDPGPGEVRLRVAYAGIRGLDIHNYRTGQWITRAPSIAGHEFSGRVEAVGPGVTAFAVGDKVVADSRYGCGTCLACAAGRAQLCPELGFVGEKIDGGFARHTTLPARLLVRCAPTADLRIAALAEPLAVALHALKRLAIPDGAPLLIVGCGPIGALTAVASACLSDRALYVADINTARQTALAALVGATPQDPGTLDPVALGLTHILDTTGNIGVIGKLIADLCGCTIGLVGIGAGEIPLDPVHLVERELSLVGCHAFDDELPWAVDLLAQYPERFAPLIGDEIALEDTPAAYQAIMEGRPNGFKTLISIDGEP